MKRVLTCVLSLALCLPATAAQTARSVALPTLAQPGPTLALVPVLPHLPVLAAAPALALPSAPAAALATLPKISQASQTAAAPKAAQGLASAAAAAPFDGSALPKASAAVAGTTGATPAPLAAANATRSSTRAVPPAPGGPKRSPWRWVKRIGLVLVGLAVAAAVAYAVLTPRLRPLPPPPVVVAPIEESGLIVDPSASLSSPAVAAAPSPDGAAVIVIGADGSWRIFEPASGRVLAPRTPSTTATGAAWLDGGASLAILNRDASVTIVERSTGKARTLSSTAADAALHSFSADGRTLAVVDSSGLVVVTDLASASAEAYQITGDPLAVAATPGRVLLATKMGAKVRLWALVSGQPPEVLVEKPLLGARLIAASVSADGSRLAAAGVLGSSQGLIAVRTADRKATGLSGEALGLDQSEIVSIALDASGERAAVVASDGRLWVWVIEDGEALLVGTGTAGAASFSADGRSILVSGPGGVRIWAAP